MSNTTDQIIYLQFISQITLASLGSLIFTFGMMGNLLNFLIFFYHSQFNKLPSSVFLLTSLIASEIDFITGLLPQLIYRISGTDPLISYEILCKLRWFVGPSAGTAALNCICLASINQYLITSRQIHRHRLITRRRAIIISILVVLGCIGILSPTMIYYSHITNSLNSTICATADSTYATYILYESIITYSIIPIVVLSFFSLLTWYNIRSSFMRQRGLEQSLTRMLLAQIIMILLTAIPNIINQLYFFITRSTQKSALRLAQENLFSTISTIFGFSTHGLAFYIYILTSKPFRKTIRSTILRK